MAFLVAKARLAALPIVAKPNVDCILKINYREEHYFDPVPVTIFRGQLRFTNAKQSLTLSLTSIVS